MRKALSALALGLAAACAAPGATLVYDTEFADQFASRGMVPLGGIQPVDLVGTPPGGLAPEAFVALLRVPGWYQPTAFALAAPGADRKGFRFVAAFGTDLNVTLCTRPEPGGDPARMAMALCLGDLAVSRASMRLGPDGDLRRDIGVLMHALLPPPKPEETAPCRRFPDC